MIHDIVRICLIVAALYCGVMYALTLIAVKRGRYLPQQRVEVEHFTFHLGLCFILAVGFLGLMEAV